MEINDLKKELSLKNKKFDETINAVDIFLTNFKSTKNDINNLIGNINLENNNNSEIINSKFSFKNRIDSKKNLSSNVFSLDKKYSNNENYYNLVIELINLLQNIIEENNLNSSILNKFKNINNRFNSLKSENILESNKSIENNNKKEISELNKLIIKQRKKINELNDEIDELNSNLVENEKDFMKKDDKIQELKKKLKSNDNTLDDTNITENLNLNKEIEKLNFKINNLENEKNIIEDEFKMEKDLLINEINELKENKKFEKSINNINSCKSFLKVNSDLKLSKRKFTEDNSNKKIVRSKSFFAPSDNNLVKNKMLEKKIIKHISDKNKNYFNDLIGILYTQTKVIEEFLN